MAQNIIKWSKHGRLLDTREIGAKGDRLARDSSTSQELPPDLPHALATQLQLWHLDWLVSVQDVGAQRSQVP
jgi:hypothetical protein